MARQVQLDKPLRISQASSEESKPNISPYIEGFVQAPGGYIAVDNFNIVIPASRDMSLYLTASAKLCQINRRDNDMSHQTQC
jgi:hypothetical protein